MITRILVNLNSDDGSLLKSPGKQSCRTNAVTKRPVKEKGRCEHDTKNRDHVDFKIPMKCLKWIRVVIHVHAYRKGDNPKKNKQKYAYAVGCLKGKLSLKALGQWNPIYNFLYGTDGTTPSTEEFVANDGEDAHESQKRKETERYCVACLQKEEGFGNHT